MLVMVVFFIAFRWIHLSTPLIRLFLLVLILLLMPTLNFLPVWFALSLLRFRIPSRLPMMFILWLVAMMVFIIFFMTVLFFAFLVLLFVACILVGVYTVKDFVTIDVLPRTSCNNVYVGFMVWSNFTATKCRGLVSLNQVIKEIICLQPLK